LLFLGIQTNSGLLRWQSLILFGLAIGKVFIYDLYDRVHVETASTDFIVWAEVALSDDAKTWRTVEPHAPIARFRKRSVEGTQTTPFQVLNPRFIRVRIFDPELPFAFASLTVLREESQPPALAEVPAPFQPANSSDTTETAWTTNLAASRVPVSRLTLATE